MKGKAGIITGGGWALCGTMARALGALGARVAVPDLDEGSARKVAEEIRRQVIARTPMGRYWEPKDLLGAVIWLLSDSSRFLTETVIPIDGGFSSYSI